MSSNTSCEWVQKLWLIHITGLLPREQSCLVKEHFRKWKQKPGVVVRWMHLGGSASDWADCVARWLINNTIFLHSVSQNLIFCTVVGVRHLELSVCLSVCMITQKRMILKFQTRTWNDLGISYEWCDFGVERSKVKVAGSQSPVAKTHWRWSKWLAWVTHSIECPPSSEKIIFLHKVNMHHSH